MKYILGIIDQSSLSTFTINLAEMLQSVEYSQQYFIIIITACSLSTKISLYYLNDNYFIMQYLFIN